MQIDHTNYPKTLKTKSLESLKFIIKDCQEAIAANPENPKNSFYQDEICYCGMEIKKRLNQGAKALDRGTEVWYNASMQTTQKIKNKFWKIRPPP